MPIPVNATFSSNFSVVGIGRARSRCSSSGSHGSRSGSPDGTGANIGSQTSSYCSNRTSTRVPMPTESGSVSTMFVVSRTRGSSSIATIAMTYGSGRFGNHC